MKHKALSIRQPWAWLIVQGHKPVENRVWETQYRGPLLIHAAKGMTTNEYVECYLFARKLGVQVPTLSELERGGIVGIATLVDCVRRADSPWFVGPVGWLLADARALPFFECRGQLSLFEVEMAEEMLNGTPSST